MNLTTASRKQLNTGTHPDKLDRQCTSYGSDHGNNGTPPCGKSHCNPYQNDKKAHWDPSEWEIPLT